MRNILYFQTTRNKGRKSAYAMLLQMVVQVYQNIRNLYVGLPSVAIARVIRNHEEEGRTEGNKSMLENDVMFIIHSLHYGRFRV